MALLLRLPKFNLSSTFVRNLSSSSSLRADLVLTFGSPSQVFYEKKKVRQVDVNALGSSFGILAAHVPTIGALRPGLLTVHHEDGKLAKFVVSSGTVTVNADSTMQVLAEEAAPLESIDAGAARDALQRAQQEATAARTDRQRAEAQIAVEAAEAVVRAVA